MLPGPARARRAAAADANLPVTESPGAGTVHRRARRLGPSHVTVRLSLSTQATEAASDSVSRLWDWQSDSESGPG